MLTTYSSGKLRVSFKKSFWGANKSIFGWMRPFGLTWTLEMFPNNSLTCIHLYFWCLVGKLSKCTHWYWLELVLPVNYCRAEISIQLVSICVFREPKETSLNWRLCIVLFMSNKVSHPSSAWWGTGRSVASPRTCGSRSFSGSPSDYIDYSVQKQLFMSLLYYSLLSSVAIQYCFCQSLSNWQNPRYISFM